MKKQLITFIILVLVLSFSGCRVNIGQPVPSVNDLNDPTKTISVPLQTVPSLTETNVPTPKIELPVDSAQNDFPWWNETVFYEIFVRSFYDSNADGIGDIQGLIQKLDYLNDGDPSTSEDLGITGIWLMPIFSSTSYHGYDVTDYYTINPDYGSMDDFKALLDAAHSRNIRVIIDFVINHTSVDHPWFLESRSNKESPYRDWYIWSDKDPEYLGPWGEDVWHFNYDNSYYYGVFWSGMPDLNFQNQNVTNEIEKISTYWLSEIGVDGFRVDGARHLIEDGKIQSNSEATLDWFQNFDKNNKALNSQIMSVGEIWDSNFSAVQYVKQDAFDLVFDFELSESLLEGINGSDGKQIINALEFNTKLYPYLQKANFLTNHDMNRLMDVFQNDQNKAKLGAIILLTSPGVPFIYYGEEIGMKGTKPDEDIRKPMQWDASENAGFSTYLPWRTPNSNYEISNVAIEEKDPESLLNVYKNLIQIRNQSEALTIGQFYPLDSKDENIVAYLRVSENQKILVIANVGNSVENLEIKISKGLFKSGQFVLSSLLEAEQFPNIEVIAEDKDVIYKISTQVPAGKYYIFEIKQK